ncbi:hypothetical protein DACRYDRAFT_97314 [Dacryopinax primogenitus]|uniref:Uncharacterized protein n=1 Tax=Dacryopinax primogenitus (strain DJM 731) TaxID=1858805 RepID=M5FPN7_DACPD|nr:uncharacterized protein DACRYDRAFT_97314 [Dacryopinax primogenitus]EJT97193.1 hypothetical protein DACRYDRAFT_97314 [Dacryopinax primogenitus]
MTCEDWQRMNKDKVSRPLRSLGRELVKQAMDEKMRSHVNANQPCMSRKLRQWRLICIPSPSTFFSQQFERTVAAVSRYPQRQCWTNEKGLIFFMVHRTSYYSATQELEHMLDEILAAGLNMSTHARQALEQRCAENPSSGTLICEDGLLTWEDFLESFGRLMQWAKKCIQRAL